MAYVFITITKQTLKMLMNRHSNIVLGQAPGCLPLQDMGSYLTRTNPAVPILCNDIVSGLALSMV